MRAQQLLARAPRRGLIKKRSCEACCSKDSQGHHPDYNSPLQVIWLCASHHKDWHTKHGPGLNG